MSAARIVPGGGFGNVGLGVSTPAKHRTRPDLCGSFGHPASTYNPWLDRTWCLCGRAVTEGDGITWPLPTGCGRPLTECLHLILTSEEPA